MIIACIRSGSAHSGCGSVLNLIFSLAVILVEKTKCLISGIPGRQGGSCITGNGNPCVLSHVATFFGRYSQKPWQPLAAQHGLSWVVVILIPLLALALIPGHLSRRILEQLFHFCRPLWKYISLVLCIFMLVPVPKLNCDV